MPKGKDKNYVVGTITTTSPPQDSVNRRKTLKKLGISGALITGAKWTSPAVVAVSLPAHAQTSTTTTTTIAGTTTTTIAGTTTTTIAGTTTTTVTTTTMQAPVAEAYICPPSVPPGGPYGSCTRITSDICGQDIDLDTLGFCVQSASEIHFNLNGLPANTSGEVTESTNTTCQNCSGTSFMTDGSGNVALSFSTGIGFNRIAINVGGCVFSIEWTGVANCP